jgi:uncharacterized protein (TIGR02996 family)
VSVYTVLDWFRNHWQAIADLYAAFDQDEQLLGCRVWTFGHLFMDIAEHNWPPPENETELRACLRQTVPRGFHCSKHVVQAKTDDDEMQMGIYLFDDHFLRKHRKLACFLLHEQWQLPAEHGEGRFRPAEEVHDLEPAGSGAGATYLVFLSFRCGSNLDELTGGYRIKRVRLPDLARHLAGVRGKKPRWPWELNELRAHLFPESKKRKSQEEAFWDAIRDDLADQANWNVYGDWLEERGLPPPGIRILDGALKRVNPYDPYPNLRRRARDLTRAEEHLAQVCLHLGRNEFHQWILFDDLWASAHPEMANAVLRFARRWDVLTTD